jgi:hypothetical protein
VVDRRVVFWIAAGVLSFWALWRLNVPHATPIDLALPWIALIVTLIAWLGDSSAVLCAVPLLAGCAISIPDVRTRLIGYGVIVAIAFCGAVLNVKELTFPRAAGFAIAGTALIRWIAREHFAFLREAMLLLFVIAIVAVAKRSAFAIALAMAAALYTPAIPLRTLAIPIAFLIVAAMARPLSTRHSALSTLALLFIAIVLTLFAYSGILARTPRWFRYGKPATSRVNLYRAMKPGETVDFDVPPDVNALILSLSNGVKLEQHAIAGRLDDRELHAGDLADWGFARREEWWLSTNHLPRRAAGLVRAYGYDGWVDGAVRFALPPNARTVRVSVDRRLPPNTLLQVEAFERCR